MPADVRPFIAALIPLIAAAATHPAMAESASPEEGRLLDLINSTRSEHGLAPVVLDARLSDVARSHSQDMTRGRYFSHISPATGSPGDRLRAAGVPFRLSGENIAFDHSVESAHQALMESPSHRRNILDSEFTHVGLGVVSNGSGIFVTEHFIRPGQGFVATAPEPRSAPTASRQPHVDALPSAPPIPWDPASAQPYPLPGRAPSLDPANPPWAAPWTSLPAVVWVLTPDGLWLPVPGPVSVQYRE